MLAIDHFGLVFVEVHGREAAFQAVLSLSVSGFTTGIMTMLGAGVSHTEPIYEVCIAAAPSYRRRS